MCLLLFLYLQAFQFAWGGEPVHLAAFVYPPFYYQEDGEVRGIAVDVIHELFDRLGAEVDVELFPMKRALLYLETGARDGIMILIKTPKRQEYIEYSDPVLTVRGLIWSATDRQGGPIDFERLDELLAYRIGVTRGYSYGNEFDELLKDTTVSVADSDLFNFRMLIAHRIDVFPCNEIVAGGILKRHPELVGKVDHSRHAFIEWVLHMGISKESPLRHRMAEINAILAELKAEGFIDAAVGRYIQ